MIKGVNKNRKENNNQVIIRHGKPKKETPYLLLFLFIIFSLFILMLRFDLWTYTLNIIERIMISYDIILLLLIFVFLAFMTRYIKRNIYLFVFYFCLIFICAVNFLINYPRSNLVNDTTCRDYHLDVVKGINSNSLVFIDGDVQTFCFIYHEYVNVISKKKDKSRVYILPNSFREKNNGRFLKQEYLFDVNNLADGFEVVRKYLNEKNIYILTFNSNVPFFHVPLGFYKEIIKKEETNYSFLRKIYLKNKKWFAKSEFLNSYDENYKSLASQSMKEFYCMKYISIVDYFVSNRREDLASRTFDDMEAYCSLSDFSLYSLLRKFNKYNSKFN